MKILLLDMDGVLLEPRGYHRALQETVALVGRLLGYRAARLTKEDVAAFEAASVINEWDSAAICAALLLRGTWTQNASATLPLTPSEPPLPEHAAAAPDFQAFVGRLARSHLGELAPLQRTESLLLGDSASRTAEQERAIKQILRHTHEVKESLTHRVFQELVLGSRVFAETYGLAPALDTPSYLLQYDWPNLSEAARARLLSWLQDTYHRAVIFTNRPSRPPAGQLSTPEAEIGARGVGLEALPIAGMGALAWLGDRRRRDYRTLTKPAPTHALTALRLALGDALQDALQVAAALVMDDQADAVWKTLDGAQVYLFEDTVPGLKSVCAARDVLGKIGVRIEVHLFGVTAREAKREPLQAFGATVVPTLAAALDNVPIW